MEDTEGLIIEADDSAYRAAAKPYKQIEFFAKVLLAAAIVGMGIVLYLLMRLWIRGRMHEAGVLLSVGISKGKIVGQMLVECLAVAVIGVLFSVVLSGTLVDICAGAAEQMTAPEENKQAYEMKVSNVGEIEVIKTSADEVELGDNVSMQVILFTAVMVWGMSSVSILLAAIKITDIEPRRLLSSM